MADPASSIKAVVAALAANSFVTLIKFAAFFLSGSGAMLSEAIHSTADSGNQLLLFIGLRRGARPRDDEFHYGYGGERFIFGILSASGIFFIGCGVTVYHGVDSLLHPHMPSINVATFAVLGASLLIEGAALVFAIRTVSKHRGDMPFMRYVREKADPAAVAILLEDSAAILGLLLAAGGIGAAYLTGNAAWDSLASIIVGLLLGVVAVYLVLANRELLMGKAVPDGVEEKFLRILRARPSVRAVHDVKTRQLTPEAYKFKAEVTFDGDFFADKLDPSLPQAGQALAGSERQETLRALSSCAIRAISEEIDAIEAAIRIEIPEAKHIDIELDHAQERGPGQRSEARDASP
jgi:solute carrier family 30 (zinc transporter), member 9